MIELMLLTLPGVAALHESCTYFDTVQFQANRGDFQDRLEKILTARYKEVDCDVEGLQVLLFMAH